MYIVAALLWHGLPTVPFRRPQVSNGENNHLQLKLTVLRELETFGQIRAMVRRPCHNVGFPPSLFCGGVSITRLSITLLSMIVSRAGGLGLARP